MKTLKERREKERRDKIKSVRWDIFQLIVLGVLSIFGVVKLAELIFSKTFM